jgi:NAD(P)-dependent dehydrogenase (short-subunit alcohol dehydrogenase family)
VAQAITNTGGKAIALAVDVGKEDQLEKMVNTTVGEFGRLDVLYNNALFVSTEFAMRDMDILKFDPEVFYANIQVNVVGSVIATKLAVPHMLERGNGSVASGGVIAYSQSTTRGD